VGRRLCTVVSCVVTTLHSSGALTYPSTRGGQGADAVVRHRSRKLTGRFFIYAQPRPYHTPCLHSQTSSLEGFGLLQISVTFLNISFLFSGWRGATLRAVLFQSLLLSEI
jgi:hypothetical protein